MAITINDYAKPLGLRANRQFYKWRVFVDEPRDTLTQIDSVEYTLHPTFPEPHQVRTDPSDNFALDASGWGEFNILVTVRYKDGREEQTQHWLDLSRAWPVSA
jgi:transcription initiation factor IIF auxiliary subunit